MSQSVSEFGAELAKLERRKVSRPKRPMSRISSVELQKVLSSKGFSTRDLSLWMGVSYSTVRNWINGKAKPHARNLEQLHALRKASKVGAQRILAARTGATSIGGPVIDVLHRVIYLRILGVGSSRQSDAPGAGLLRDIEDIDRLAEQHVLIPA